MFFRILKMTNFEDLIIPKTYEECRAINSLFNTYKQYKLYKPVVGDIFYYSTWWLSSSQCGCQIDMNLSFHKREAYMKDINSIFERDIYHINDKYHDFDIYKTLGGYYKVSNIVSEVGKTKVMYLNSTPYLEDDDKKNHPILNIENNKDNLIIADTFDNLLKNIEVFTDIFNFNIATYIETLFEKRLKQLNTLTSK